MHQPVNASGPGLVHTQDRMLLFSPDDLHKPVHVQVAPEMIRQKVVLGVPEIRRAFGHAHGARATGLSGVDYRPPAASPIQQSIQTGDGAVEEVDTSG